MLQWSKASTSREKLTSLAAVLLPASILVTLLNWIIIGLFSSIAFNAKIDQIDIPRHVAGLSSKPIAMSETLVRNPSMASRLSAEVEVVHIP